MSTQEGHWTTLGDVAQWGSGGTPSAGDSSLYGGDIPWAVIGDLNDGTVESTAKTISSKGLEKSSAKLVPPGAVLIAMYGSIGKLGINAIPMATNQAIAFAIPKSELIDRDFLFWLLMQERPRFVKEGKGATQQNISQTLLKAWKVWLPPIERQHKIVERIEAALARLDASAISLLESSHKLATLNRAVVHKLMSSADELQTVTLGEIAQVNWGDTSKTKSSYVSEGFTAFSASGPDGLIGNFQFEGPGFVLSAIGANCGRVFRAEGKWGAIKNTITILPNLEIVDPDFLGFSLSDPNLWAKRGAAQPFIRQTDARAREVLLPPLETQLAIASELREQLVFANRVRAQLDMVLAQLSRIRKSLLHSEFGASDQDD